DNNFYITMNFENNVFYIFDSKTCNELENRPIAQIKYIPNLLNDKQMFIRRLEFINNDYSKKGIASLMLKCFEEFCKNNGFTSITGEFDPLHNVSPVVVEKFYRRNGYNIVNGKDNKPMIEKNILENKNDNECLN
ncbi:MAG: GNAT family N-acetyltransferase, partial [Clostridiales bacterium]|nr:GNAT family N-acetyltransferase [Candidatus Apopatousia equi]